MSLIQDKLGNEFLRGGNGGMDPNFAPASMLMFSHLPPVTSFTRLAPPQSVMADLPQDMILKKERPDSPDHLGMGAGGFLHGMGIKQEKLSELDYRLPLYGMPPTTTSSGTVGGHHMNNVVPVTVGQGMGGVGVGGKGPGSMDMLDMSLGNHQSMLLHDPGLSNFSSGRLGKEPKEGGSGRRKKANGEGHEGKRRKRGDAAKALMLDGEDGPLSPNSKPHICEHCNAAFRSSYHLRRHVLIHTGERPFRCSQCNMSFIQKYLLQRHEKIHSGEKPFSCDQCNMRFIQKYHMERHKRTHSGEKPYKCENCQQYFSRTDRLLKHKRTCEEAIKKGLDPSLLELGEDELAQGSYLLTQGSPAPPAPATGGRKRGKGKGGDGGEGAPRRRKKANPSSSSSASSSLHMPRGLGLQDYGAADHHLASGSGAGGQAGGASSGGAHMGRTPKLLFKKGRNKGLDKTLLALGAGGDGAGGSGAGLKMAGGQGGNGGMDGLGLMQDSAGTKQSGNSSNYDDAMQFLKKRRYLHAANNNNNNSGGGSNTSGNGGNQPGDYGHLAPPPPQQNVIQTGLPGEPTLALLDTSPLISVDLKHMDKSGIPDEVLQSLLDHYSHKPDAHHHHSHLHSHHHPHHHHHDPHHHHHDDVTFDLSGSHHVELQPAEVVDVGDEDVDTSPGGHKTVVMSEYSKFLLQTLERTSHSSGFTLGPAAPFPSLLTSSSPGPSPSPSTFSTSDKHGGGYGVSTSPLDCGAYSQPVGSPLAPASSSSSSSSAVGGGGSGGYHLNSLEPTTHQQLTPSQELTEQLEKHQHSPPFQLTADEPQKDRKNGSGGGSDGGSVAGSNGGATNGSGNNGPVYPDLAPLEPSKDVELRSTYQIENFAQAFGQFKAGRGTEFSGYSSLLADVGEPTSSGSKTPTSQSFR
ncbi:zinc finger protein 281b isoform X2 [Engraulis encrasicolus]|uniref:zinc finger protein 281b isoform X2 n=1 Tax=Engraulis encrasicolus TaxID=184585 RepID=UPI002FD6F04E